MLLLYMVQNQLGTIKINKAIKSIWVHEVLTQGSHQETSKETNLS